MECGRSGCGLKEMGEAVAVVVHKMVAWAERAVEMERSRQLLETRPVRLGDCWDEGKGKGETKDTSWVRKSFLT